MDVTGVRNSFLLTVLTFSPDFGGNLIFKKKFMKKMFLINI